MKRIHDGTVSKGSYVIPRYHRALDAARKYESRIFNRTLGRGAYVGSNHPIWDMQFPVKKYMANTTG